MGHGFIRRVGVVVEVRVPESGSLVFLALGDYNVSRMSLRIYYLHWIQRQPRE